jgi:hypothetical protein
VVVWRTPPELDLQQVLQLALVVVCELLALHRHHPHQFEPVMLLLVVLEQQVQEHCTPWWLTRW